MKRSERMPDALTVLLGGRTIGRVERSGNRLKFVYDEDWRANGPVIPLSLSMPLSGTQYGHDVVNNWLWGLLTDNERTLGRIATQHQVSANNVFALLWVVGEDCSGAVQFAEPEHVSDMVQGGDIHWLDDAEIGARLARLRQDYSTGRAQSEGQFSLAGAQPKTALVNADGRWGVPSGRIPTTHILKPPIHDLDGHAENEVFCLRLASKIGLRAAHADVKRFAGELAIVVERYDRVRTRSGDIVRVHQEDLCQAMGVHPSGKYEKDGGPGIKRIMEELTWSSNPEVDRRRFMEATALNFLIGGTDAHAKNYSVLFGPRQARLAPLYDIASYLPYFEGRWQDVRMPMKVDKYYCYADVMPRHWERMSRSCGYPADEAIGHVARLVFELPDAAAAAAADLRAQGVDHPVLGVLVDKITWRCADVARKWGLAKLEAPVKASDREP